MPYLFKRLNKYKKLGQRALSVLCLVLVCFALFGFENLKTVNTPDDSDPTRTINRPLQEETPAIWETTLPALSGYPAADIVRIAESQRGYAESTVNVEVAELPGGGTESHGYTRYGEFVGDPYCDNWSAAFACFCLYYSGMTETDAPRDADCAAMMRRWNDAGVYSAKTAHSAQPGDLAFIDRDGNGVADSVGVVTFADSRTITVIEGNSNDRVEENRISLSGGTVLGFGVTTADPSSDKRSENTSGLSWTESPRKSLKKARGGTSGTRSSPPSADMDLDDYITDVTATGTTKVGENQYMTLIELSFAIDPAIVWELTEAGYKIVFDLPEEIEIHDDIINDGPFYAYKVDSHPLELAFTYNFVPNGDGTFHIEFYYDEDYLQSAIESGSEHIFNLLRFKCYINTEDDDHTNGLDISFTNNQSLYIPPDEINENYDISTYKTGSFTSAGKLRYEVTVSTVNGTPSTVDINDSFIYSGNGTVTPPSTVTVVRYNANGTVAETYEVPAAGHITTTTQNGFDIDLSLPQLHDNEYYKLVYEYGTTGISNEEAVFSAYNSIEATSTNGNDLTIDTAEYFLYNQKRNEIGKDGIPFGDYVQWSITVNARGEDIAGKVVYDESFADARNETINGTNGIVVQKGWAEATPGVDYEFVYGGGGEIVGIRFLPADAATANNNLYHVTYYTYPDVAYGETGIEHNEAEFDGDVASYDVVVHGGDFEKTSDGDESIGNDHYTMDWTVKVKVPMGGILSGTSFSDTLSPAGHYMTQAQFSALSTALAAAWGIPVSLTPTYTGNDITGYTFTVGTAGGGYLLDNGFTDEIVWHYETTGDMTGKTRETFLNTFTDGEKTLPVGHSISPNVKKLNARKVSDWQTIFTEEPTTLQFDHETGDDFFVWIVEVTPTTGVMQYRVTDTLPDGVELVGIKVMPSPLTAYNYGIDAYVNNNLTINNDGTLYGEIGQLWLSKTTATGTITTAADGRQVVDILLTPNSANADLFKQTFNVIYYCRLAEDAWPASGTVRLELDNTVTVLADGADYGDAENQIVVEATNTQDIVGKTASWDKNTHLITYTVDINPTAENLLTSSGGMLDPEWLTLTDVLTYKAKKGVGTGDVVLDLNSVVLEKEENGVWSTMNRVQWTARTENDPDDPDGKQAIIEMRVPDSTHLRLTYSYHVNSSMDDGIMLRNSLTVEGHADESGDHDIHIDLEDFQTSAQSTYEEFRLIKIDEENGQPLAGAVFTVYEWDAVNEEWDMTDKSYTTDADGKIIVKGSDEHENGTKMYDTDTAYCIMETTAPTGYLLPPDPPPFYFWFSDEEDAPLYAPADFMQTAADISKSSHRIEAENQCLPDYIPEAGIFDTNLLPSLVLLLVSGVGTVLLVMLFIRRKRGGREA